jgi:hypothetical protein
VSSASASAWAALAPGTFDLAALGLLLLCALWGWWRGAPGQILSLALLLGALVAARWLGPRLEEPVSQAVLLEPVALPAAAFAVGALAALLVAGVVVHALTGLLPPREPGPPRGRWLGALLGLVKGLVVLVPLGYGVLYSLPEGEAGRLAGESRTAAWLPELRRALSGVQLLPPSTEGLSSVVEQRLGLPE